MLELDENEFYLNSDNYYTRREVCNILGITDLYLSQLTAKKLIPMIKFGKEIKFLKSWINEWNILRSVSINPNEALKNIQIK